MTWRTKCDQRVQPGARCPYEIGKGTSIAASTASPSSQSLLLFKFIVQVLVLLTSHTLPSTPSGHNNMNKHTRLTHGSANGTATHCLSVLLTRHTLLIWPLAHVSRQHSFQAPLIPHVLRLLRVLARGLAFCFLLARRGAGLTSSMCVGGCIHIHVLSIAQHSYRENIDNKKRHESKWGPTTLVV